MEAKRTLLIIEDQDDYQEILKTLLHTGYHILTAANGLEGINLLLEQKDNISVVLLDMEMPVMDGFEFLKEMQRNYALRRIPVIITSGNGNPGDEERCLELGASDFLYKPYNPKLAAARIKNVVRLSEASRELHELERDELTGLYTKRAFLNHGERIIREHPDRKYGILGFDIENFKMANSQYGEKKCDEFLAFLGRKILCLMKDVLVGRFGGDQFVFMYEITPDISNFSKNWIKDNLLEDAPIPHQILKKGVYAPIDPSVPLVRCCDRAFMAIRQIKGVYQKDIAFYDSAMKQQMMDEQKILDSMEDALAQEQFQVYYQPKHDSNTGELAGVEALVRWVHPEYGYMLPGQFIPLFERNGFVTKLDAFVVKQVCRDLKRWIGMNIPVVPISVNVSRRDYMEENWIERQLSYIADQEIHHSLIHMEVTESLYAEHTDLLVSKLKKVQERGHLIEMDDFGAGYSSLGMLATFPLDVIKLDISFVKQIDVNEIVIENIINLAHRMGFKTVAEGVETERQYQVLRGLGCDYIQGFYFSKPLSVTEFEEYMKQAKFKTDMDKEGERDGQKWSEIADELEIKNTLLSCIDTLVTKADSQNGINRLLSVIGKYYEADRAYIFEFDKDCLAAINTFEWCKIGVMPTIDACHSLDFRLVEGWVKAFENQNAFFMPSVPAIKDTEPDFYEILVAQKVDSLMAAPIRSGSKIVGFIGVDNPTAHTKTLELMQSVTSFIITVLDRTRYIDRLEDAGYKDSLTDARNRRAYYKDLVEIEEMPELREMSVGIVFADVNGLKRTNDREGHEAGDRLIKAVAQKLRSIFDERYIYRMGGDEFIVLDFGSSEEVFRKRTELLQKNWTEEYSAALGCIWLPEATNLEQNVAKADKEMYLDKSKYYEQRGRDRRGSRGTDPRTEDRRLSENPGIAGENQGIDFAALAKNMDDMDEAEASGKTDDNVVSSIINMGESSDKLMFEEVEKLKTGNFRGEPDISVPVGNGFVNIRVGAIIMKNGKLLMVGNDRADYLYSVGGRIKFGETAEQAVVREVFEETGVHMEIDRLGFVHENYFLGDTSEKNEKLVYEISYFFYMKTPEDFEPVGGSFTEDDCQEYLKWISPDTEQKYYPEFFRSELLIPQAGVRYMVTDQRR